MRARTAVIPAAGLGTRFHPATKAIPKELLPIIDTPALQLVIDEAVSAGMHRIVIVTSRSKPALEAYVAAAPEVVARKGADGPAVTVQFAYQDQPRGLGHAVACAREAVGDEPFAVLLPDEIMGDPSLLARLADECDRTGGSVVGLKRVPRAEVSAYGVVEPVGEPDASGLVGISGMVEKPPVETAPSDLIIIGRYVLTPDVFDALETVAPGASGEIQLTDALRMQAAAGPFHGVVGEVRRHDTGTPFGWLTAVVDLALDDERVGERFRVWLDQRTRRD